MKKLVDKEGYLANLSGYPSSYPSELGFNITRPRLFQYTGQTSYSDAREKLLFYAGRDYFNALLDVPGRTEYPYCKTNTVIKVTGDKKTGLDVMVGGMKVVSLPLTPRDLFPVDYINRLDTLHGKIATDQLLSTLQFESIYDRARAIFGTKNTKGGREEWVEDFLEMVYPRYSRQKISPPPILERMYSHVGTIGHLDHGVSTLSRAIQGEPLTDWVSKHWKEYIAQTSDIDETIEDKEHNVIPVHLPGEPTQVPVFDEFGKPLKSEDPK